MQNALELLIINKFNLHLTISISSIRLRVPTGVKYFKQKQTNKQMKTHNLF